MPRDACGVERASSSVSRACCGVGYSYGDEPKYLDGKSQDHLRRLDVAICVSFHCVGTVMDQAGCIYTALPLSVEPHPACSAPTMSYYAETPMTLDENNIYSYPFPYGFVPSVYYDPYTYPITPQSQPSQCSQPGPLTASPAVLFSQPESVYPESGCLSVDSLRPSPTPMYHSPMPMYASPTTLYHPPTPSLTTAKAQSVYDVPPQQQHSPGPSIFPPAHDLSMQYEQYRAPHKVVEPSTKKRSRTAQACEKCRIRKAKVR